MRIDALLSRYGFCSRKEAAQWIKRGRVAIAGEPARSGAEKAEPVDVLVDGKAIEFPDGVYVAFFKPLGATCSHKDDEGELIYDYLPEQWMQRNPPVTSVGRLDKETEGLLLLTDDGKFVHKLTSPKYHMPKVYEMTTEADIPEETVALFLSGTLHLQGEKAPCLPATLEILSPRHAKITLVEGKYHQIRRMMASAGAPVATLKRLSIGPLSLDSLNLSPGEWTPVSPLIFDS